MEQSLNCEYMVTYVRFRYNIGISAKNGRNLHLENYIELSILFRAEHHYPQAEEQIPQMLTQESPDMHRESSLTYPGIFICYL